MFLIKLTHEKQIGTAYDYSRSFSANNISSFLRDVANERWDNVYKLSDGNRAFDAFYDTFMFHFQSNSPMKKFYEKQGKACVDNDVKYSSCYLKDFCSLKKHYNIQTKYTRNVSLITLI